MIREIMQTVSQVSVYILTLNLLILILFFKKIPFKIRTIISFLIIALITELYSKWLSKQNINNLFLLHIYTLFEFLAWSYFYLCLFKNKKWAKKILPWVVGTISIFIIANSILLQPFSGFNTYAKTLVQLSLISFAIYYFFNTF